MTCSHDKKCEDTECRCKNSTTSLEMKLLQSESIKNFCLQVLELHPNAKIKFNKKNNVTSISEIKISEESLKTLFFNLKVKNDVHLKSVKFGIHDDTNEIQNFTHSTNDIISKVICKSFMSKLKKYILTHLDESDETPTKLISLKVGHVFDTRKIDDINDILDNNSSRGRVKYLTGISLQTKNNDNELMGGAISETCSTYKTPFGISKQNCNYF